MKISIIGLGYVGLPLLIELSKKFKTVGYDSDSKRISELKKGFDRNDANKIQKIKLKKKILTDKIENIKDSDVYIITLPTPVNIKNLPDLKNIISITRDISNYIKNKNLVIYESTFYPGLTEETLVPILEKGSNLKCRFEKNNIKKYFSVGYSPERINPGDKIHTIKNIKKIISASNKIALKIMNNIYSTIINAGVYETLSIKTAEASKVIENIQRDINIALVNEFSKIFNKMNLDTSEVLKAASTKWNFVNFEPGFVGGHCIGIDPYYLAFKAKQIGIQPKIILQGRKINEGMSNYAAKMIFKKSKIHRVNFNKAKVLIMGFAFKENCNDIRNTKIFDLYKQLKQKFKFIDLFDPYVDKLETKKYYKINIYEKAPKKTYDILIVAVKHKKFKLHSFEDMNIKCKKNYLLFDLKNTYPKLHSEFSL